MATPAASTHEFKAEVTALLRLVTNSLYTNRDVFLRELVSNASDALDKARFAAQTDRSLRDPDAEGVIRVVADKDAKVLVIEDTGIGMSRDELAENLGTIAHSGTLAFLEKLQESGDKKADLNLIGQFGVGFYSAFMVADKIVVDTRSAHDGDESARWESAGDGTFTISESDKTVRGTRIELHLKDDAAEYLERFKVESVVKLYSNYVVHPVLFENAQPEEGEKPARLNSASPIWVRNPKELEDEDYAEFYSHVMGGFVLPGDKPRARLHFSMDAPIQFHALLFVPSRAPLDLFSQERRGVELFAKRIMVMESSDKLLPPYLRFFRGVVDSEDLPLNVSREMLQEHSSLSAIRRQLTRKAIKLLTSLASDDAESYDALWTEFGAVIKEGIHTDNGHREELTSLLRYGVVGMDAEQVSLAQYVAAMAPGQDAIYFITGSPEDDLATSPHLEACQARGFPVLLMTDAVDEWVISELREFEGKPLKNVAQGAFDQAGDHKEEQSDALGALQERAKKILGERVKDVRASARLTSSAACLVDEEGGLSRNMERILRAANRSVTNRARILELNPTHSFVVAAKSLAESGKDPERLATWVELLHDQANLAEGLVPDPAGIVKRIQAVLDQIAGQAL